MWNLLIRSTSGLLLIFIFFFLISCEGNLTANNEEHTEYEKEIDAIKLGVKIIAPTPYPEIYFDDLIHPCVRFISEGFAGHQWWMTGTPYFGGNNQIENPILFYGDSRPGNLPPLKWTAWGIISETPLPAKAYNSDPNLFWDGKGLWILWRENFSVDCINNKMTRATFGIYSIDGITFTQKKFFAGEPSGTEDSEMCPTVIEFNKIIRLYGVKHQFTAPRVPLGLTIWDIQGNDLKNNFFTKTKDLLPVYKTGFDLWHTDFFVYDNLIFCVATPETADEVLLGISGDGEHFTFWDKPLLSTKGTGRQYFYKASAMVHNGIFYLWTPVAEEGVSPKTSRIWMSEILFSELLQKLTNNSITQSENILGFVNVLVKNISGGLELYLNNQISEITLFDLQGRLVYHSKNNSGTVKIKANSGIYVLKINNQSKKVIIQ